MLFTIFFSCQKEIEFDKRLIAPKIVINGFIEIDSLIDVNVAVSKTIPGIEQAFTWIDDATVTLYVDGVEAEKLVSYNIDYPANNENNYYSQRSVESRPTKGYRTQKTVGEIGKKYKLVVSHPNYETASAENYIPEKVEIISFESEEKLESNENYGYDYNILNIKLKFKDKANEKNYYRLSVRSFTGKWSPNWREKNDTTGIIEVSLQYPGYLIQNDPILNPDKEGANDFLSSSPPNRYSVFTDEFIDGKEHQLEFGLSLSNLMWVNGEMISPEQKEGEFYQYQISLQTITRETYLYLVSSYANQWYSGDFFSEPVQVFSNVENGVGIFGGFTSSSFNLSKGEYPIEGIEYEINDHGYGGSYFY